MLHDWRTKMHQTPRLLVDNSHTQATRVETHPPEHCSALLNKQDFTHQITQDCVDADIETPIPNTIEETLLALTQVRKEIRDSEKKVANYA
jgi:hypothetical protein